MNIRWYPVAWPRIDRAVIAGVLLLVTVSFTSCGRLRTPQQLLVEPDSRDNPRLVARAKELYLRNCAICHTETGQGEGRYFASDLEPKPTDLTLKSTQIRDMDDLQRWIQEGSSGFGRSKLCPAWGQTMTAEDTAALARYVLSLRNPKPPMADDQRGDEAKGDGQSTAR